jgi:hypothetical protein
LRAAANQVKGLDFEPTGLIGGGSSHFRAMAEKDNFAGDSTVSRVSKGLELGHPGNQISQVLNERGPALKVFWSPELPGDGRRVGERTRLPKWTRVVIEQLTKKTEPEGARARAIPSAPFGSKVELGHPLTTR